EVEDILSIGFLFHAHVDTWNREKPYLLARDMGSDMPEEKKAAFLAQTSYSAEEMRAALEGRSSPFDFLPIQERPILRLDPGFLVLDEQYLWERVTRGLYWMVHDHERDHVGDSARQAWTQAYGEMIELMVEDQVRQMAPPDLGGGTT